VLDEIEHARTMYAFASAYRGAPCGPGALDVNGAIGAHGQGGDRMAKLTAFALETLEDACIGETAGALVARRSAEAARAPALRNALATIAEDEARHAELAWRMLAWAVREGGARVVEAVRARLADLASRVQSGDARHEEALTAEDLAVHGVLSRGAEQEILAATLREVVVPCVAALAIESEDASSIFVAPITLKSPCVGITRS
jgi:hypothetical protein